MRHPPSYMQIDGEKARFMSGSTDIFMGGCMWTLKTVCEIPRLPSTGNNYEGNAKIMLCHCVYVEEISIITEAVVNKLVR